MKKQVEKAICQMAGHSFVPKAYEDHTTNIIELYCSRCAVIVDLRNPRRVEPQEVLKGIQPGL